MQKPRTSPTEALRQAHATLLGDLRMLEEAVRSPSRRDSADLSARLMAVREHLTEHFRFEEQNGYMASVLTREPRLERTVQQLLNQHRQLKQALDALIEEINTGSNPNNTMGEKIHAWVEQVRQHESRENVLVEDAFNFDVSAED